MDAKKIVNDFNTTLDKIQAYGKISEVTFKKELLPLMGGKNNEDLMRRWEYLAGGLTKQLIVTDDDGNTLFKTPGLLDNTVAFKLDDSISTPTSEQIMATADKNELRVRDAKVNVEKALVKNINTATVSKWSEIIKRYSTDVKGVDVVAANKDSNRANMVTIDDLDM